MTSHTRSHITNRKNAHGFLFDFNGCQSSIFNRLKITDLIQWRLTKLGQRPTGATKNSIPTIDVVKLKLERIEIVKTSQITDTIDVLLVVFLALTVTLHRLVSFVVPHTVQDRTRSSFNPLTMSPTHRRRRKKAAANFFFFFVS